MGSDPGIKGRVIYIWSDPSFIPMASHNKLIRVIQWQPAFPGWFFFGAHIVWTHVVSLFVHGWQGEPSHVWGLQKALETPFPVSPVKNICLLLGKENT